MYENDMKIIERAQNGSKEDMTKLIEDNSRLVWSIVRRFNGRGYDIEDLYQIGSIGLIKAIQRFDTSFEVRLSTYAVPYILGEIKRFIRDDGRVKISRSIKELGYKIREMQNEQIRKNGEELSIEELARELKISKEDVALAIEVNASNIVTSINEPAFGKDSEKETSVEDILPDKQNQEKEITDKLTINKLIQELTPKEQDVVILRYFKEETQSQVAKRLGISQVQVSRIEKKVLAVMREKLI